MSSFQSPAAPERPVGRLATDDRIRYGAVHLDVRELERSLPFWQEAVGLELIDRSPERAVLGTGQRPLIVLHPGARHVASRGNAGLYHVAVHVEDALEFARALARLSLARVPQSPSDHIFSKATYVHDPDGLMLELTLETPERIGSLEVNETSVVVRDSSGRRRSPTEPLDVEAALAPLGDHDPRGPLAAGTTVGHVHLHVPELRGAFDFYRDVIGFEEHAFMTPIGMADLSAGGRFPHRLALNDWNGPSARQPAPGTAGLRHFELVVSDPAELAAFAERAQAAGRPGHTDAAGCELTDPAGNALTITLAKPR